MDNVKEEYARGYGIDIGQPTVTKHRRADRLVTDHDIRCQAKTRPDPDVPGEKIICGKLMARMVSRPWLLMCPRCKSSNKSPS